MSDTDSAASRWARSPYLPVDRRLLHYGPRLGPEGIAVYVALVELALHGADLPPLDAVAELTGLDIERVGAALAALERLGAAERTNEGGVAGWRPRRVSALPEVGERPRRGR